MIKCKYFLLLILVCLLSANSIIAQSQESIFQLANFPVVAGFEKPLLEEVKQKLPAWAKAEFDNMDNLIVTINSKEPSSTSRLIVVPVDEFGYVVSEIQEDGYLRLQFVQTIVPTKLFHQFHEGQPISIYTEKGVVNGVTAILSTHLQRNRTRTNNNICQPDDIWVDIGARSRQEVIASGVKLLDPISLQNRATKLGQHQVAAPSAGLRGGVTAILSLINNLSPENINGTLTIAFVTQETFGRKGIDRLARSCSAKETILITDGWTATNLNAAEEKKELSSIGQVGNLGQGPIVVADDSYWSDSQQIQKVPDMRTRRAIYTQGPVLEGTKLHLIALPTLFSSSTVEVVDSRDAKALTKMLLAKVTKQAVNFTDKEISFSKPKTSAKTLSTEAQVLKDLVESYGVSGYEKGVREKIKTLLPKWASPKTDERGNLILTVGNGKPHLVFAAHMDEIGYKINAINDDGRASVTKLGGFYDSLFEAHTMLTHIGNGESVACVLAPRRNYFQTETRPPNLSDLVLYFGTSSREETEKLGIQVGSSITMPKQYHSLQGNRANGRSFDDRVGSASLVLALQKLDPNKLKQKITFVWTVEEETGLDGAQDVASRLGSDVDYVFAVDTFVSSDSPVEIKRFADAPIGKGAVIRAMDNSNIIPRPILNKMLALASKNNIAIQYGVTGGGNDGAVFTQYGAIDIPISWPLRYSHSPAEVIDLADLEALTNLVKAISEGFSE